MRTLAYDGPCLVHVRSLEPPAPTGSIDAIVQITATRIWAQDRPIYQGRLDHVEGALVRHESLADVLEVGAGPSMTRVGDVLCLRLTIACGKCSNCEMNIPGQCTAAQPGPGGVGIQNVTAGAWSVRAPELDDAWQRMSGLLHTHPPGLPSAPLGRAVLTHLGSDGSRPEETPTDYRHFDRWDDAWVSVVHRPNEPVPIGR